ncbi:MAG TPA: hypothetical protein VFY10_12945 [Dehalococcoidia bacterium]|nr:hypothetical protein [Dehalococcoidia bacterium]
MLIVILAQSGSHVVLPDAVDAREGETPDTVDFVDAQGRILANFQRADVSMFGPSDRFPDGGPDSVP